MRSTLPSPKSWICTLSTTQQTAPPTARPSAAPEPDVAALVIAHYNPNMPGTVLHNGTPGSGVPMTKPFKELCSPTSKATTHAADAWRVAGPVFVGPGGGLRYAFSDRAALTLDVKLALVFGNAFMLTRRPSWCFSTGSERFLGSGCSAAPRWNQQCHPEERSDEGAPCGRGSVSTGGSFASLRMTVRLLSTRRAAVAWQEPRRALTIQVGQ
jgi:hypothetical protein